MSSTGRQAQLEKAAALLLGMAVGFVDDCASVAYNVQERKLQQYSRQGPKVKEDMNSAQCTEVWTMCSAEYFAPD